MPRIQIKDFGKVKTADINFGEGKIALLVGTNEMGKSTVAEGAGFAVARGGFGAKTHAGIYVRSGASKAEIIVSNEDDKTVRLTFPDCKIEDNHGPSASELSAGLLAFHKMTKPEKAAHMQKMLKLDPSKEEVQEHLKKFRCADDLIANVWDYIEQHTWDKAHADFKQRGAKYKGQWEEVTGRSYQPANGGSWIPDGYENDLATKSEEGLNETLVHERGILDGLKIYEAISEKEISELHEQWLGITEAEKAVGHLAKEIGEIKAASKEQVQLLSAAPKPDAKQELTHPCPHCAKDVVIRGALLAKPSVKLTDKEKAERSTAVDDLLAMIRETNDLLLEKEEQLAKAKQSQSIANAARARLDEIAALQDAKGKKATVSDVEKQRALVEQAEKRLNAFKKKTAADKKHDAIVELQFIIDMCKPDGLRLTKLKAGIAEFQKEYLDRLCETAKWRQVVLDENLDLWYGGYTYRRCSKGARQRIRAVIQIAFSYFERPDIIILDGMDHLDLSGLSELFDLLENLDSYSIVTTTKVEREKDIPDLEEWGIGKTYLMTDGVSSQFKAKKKEKATA